MTNETYETLSDMLGDNATEFIAKDLKKTYATLISSLKNPQGAPYVSDDPEVETEFILSTLKAIEKVYSWYDTANIKD